MYIKLLIFAMAALFIVLIVLVGFAFNVLTSSSWIVLKIASVLAVFASAFIEYALFYSLDRYLDKTESLGSRFGRDFKGDYKSSPGPYGQGLRGIGGKTLTKDD